MIHDSNVDVFSVFITLKGAEHIPPLCRSKANMLHSTGLNAHTLSGAIPKKGTTSERAILSQVQNLTTASSNTVQPNQSTTIEVVNLLSATPLMNSHKFHLACLNCHVITTNEINVTPHYCDRNIVLCREKSDNKKFSWQRIRPKPATSLRPSLAPFGMCRDFPRCPRSLRCTSAHSEIERSIWNRELKDGRILIPVNLIDYLSHSLVSKSHRSIDVPHSKNYTNIWVGCQNCMTVVTKGYCQVLKYKHDCQKDIVLCRDDAWRHHFWVVVRPRVDGCGLYELCRHVERNDCWQWRTCKFAHSDFEFNLWKFDDKKARRIDLSKLIDDELTFWRSSGINYRIVEPKPVMKVLQQPTAVVSSTRLPFDDGVQEQSNPFGYLNENIERKRKRQSPTETSGEPFASPYRVHYVCGICYYRYKRIIYRRTGASNKCDNSKEPHDFEIHKRLMIFDDNSKAYDLRRLPDFLLSKSAKSTSICKLVAEGKACKREVCYFAHSEIERRCWTFLLRHNKDVYDIITEPFPAETSASHQSTARISQPLKSTKLELPSSAVWGTSTNSAYVQLEVIKGLQDDALYCFLCEKRYSNETKFEEHCSSVEHDEKLDIDQKREWTCRPPRGKPPFKLCKRHLNGENCVYSKSSSNFCSDAHSDDELNEWNERILFLQEESKRKPNDKLKAVYEKVETTKLKPDSILNMKSNSNAFGFTSIDMNGTPVVNATSEEREKKFRWLFTINAEIPLKRVALIDKQFLFYFRLLSPNGSTINSSACDGVSFLDENIDLYYEVQVEFMGSKSLGTFTQEVIFDFGDSVPMIRECLTVNIGISEMQLKHLSELRDLLTSSEVWTSENTEIHWISKPNSHNPLINAVNPSDVVSNLHLKLNEQTYFKTMRKLIVAEEMRRQAILSGFRVKADAFLGQTLPTNDEENSIVQENRLFAQVPLDFELSEDFDISDLLINDCDYAFVAVPENMAQKTETGKRHVYEVEIINRRKFGYDGINKDCIFLCLSSSFISYFRLKPGCCVPLEIQFNLKRDSFKPFSKCLNLLEKKEMAHFVFPNLISRFNSFFTGKVAEESKSKISQYIYLEHKWKNSDNNNDEQVRVIRHVVTCATNKTHWIPPMVIYGPFGTGKTRTLSQAVCTLLIQPNLEHTKILICTQSNSTADLYLKHLENYSKLNTDTLKRLVWRLFPSHTIPEKLQPAIRPYVRLNDDKTELDKLTVEKLKTVRVVICTTSGVNRLVKLVDEKSSVSFTHIFMDEAAQALEVEMLQPLCVATNMTCVVVAGDHHQIRPTAYFSEAEELQYSYLERLFKSYDDQEKTVNDIVKPSCHIPKILFTKNYRCHADILAFLSASFYDGCNLTACATVPENNLKPMYFAMAVGKEQILPGGISLSNRNEVEEVMCQVAYFWENWPQSFGEKDIGIVVNSHDQVKLIREQLNNKRCYPSNRVQVGKTIMMQGKEFKVLIVSTVRARNLLERPLSQRRKLGFLDDDRLINTAITRARYCVVVVGDPVVLCTIGKCKSVWRRYINYCFEKESFLPERYTNEQLQAEILIAEARLNESSGVDQNVLLLASQAVSKLSGF